jgi:hypothetical protein
MSLTWECQQQLVRVRSAGLWLPFVDPFGVSPATEELGATKLSTFACYQFSRLFVCLFVSRISYGVFSWLLNGQRIGREKADYDASSHGLLLTGLSP